VVPVTPTGEGVSDEAAGRSAGDRSAPIPDTTADATGQPADRRDTLRALATRGGEVVVAERRRALREFDDGSGVSPETQRIVSTMAVRIVVQLVRRPAAAVATDDHAAEVAADLFVPDE
jgi:hypothetical protein